MHISKGRMIFAPILKWSFSVYLRRRFHFLICADFISSPNCIYSLTGHAYISESQYKWSRERYTYCSTHLNLECLCIDNYVCNFYRWNFLVLSEILNFYQLYTLHGNNFKLPLIYALFKIPAKDKNLKCYEVNPN